MEAPKDMAVGMRNRGANVLLWAGLAMVGTALILGLVCSFYAGRGAPFPGPGGMMGTLMAARVSERRGRWRRSLMPVPPLGVLLKATATPI